MIDLKEKPASHYSSSIQFNDTEKRETNILKFINEKNSWKRIEGKKCKPKQMFGYNHQSPDNFKTKHSLKADYGYFYPFDGNPECQKFEHYSQKHFIKIDNAVQTTDNNNKGEFSKKYQQSYNRNKLAFHRRKGRLSEFMDKNGWMKPSCIIMGNQRSKTARICNNKDRQKAILAKQQEMKKKQKIMSAPKYPKSSHTRFGQILFGEKMKLREMRNQFASLQNTENLTEQREKSRPLTTMSVKKKMQKDQIQTTKSLRLFDNKPKQFHKTIDLWDKEDNQKIKIMQWTKPEKTDEWMQTTCGSKFSNPRSAFQNRKRSSIKERNQQ